MSRISLSLSMIAIISLSVLSSCIRSNQPTAMTTSNATSNMTTSSRVSTVSASPAQSINKTVTYSTDRGKERVTATFSITTNSTGEITTVSSSTTSADRESRQYISRFNSAARSQIIGRKISELSLSVVGGASDTTDAFMQVVSAL